MSQRRRSCACLLLIALSSLSNWTGAAADSIADIRDEALRRSMVMEWVRALTVSPRLTGSPTLDAAGDWAERQLKEIGLANVHIERWPFERRWTALSVDVQVVEPQPITLVASPQTWSPGTQGVQTGPLRVARVTNTTAFDRDAGRLRGAFVLVSGDDSIRSDVYNRFQQLLRSQGAIATLERSVGPDSKVVYARTGHTPEQDDRQLLVPSIAVRPADFRQLERLVDRDSDVVLRANVSIREEPGGSQVGFNVIADHVGTQPSEAPVMIGAHLDSIHLAQGATDNAAGCSVLIEAVRVLAAVNARPKRTIRIALWGGEEQGRRGSRAYVEAQRQRLPAVYFNMDRGSGPITAIIIEGNNPLAYDAEQWSRRLRSEGLRTVVSATTAGSDHISFRDAGVPTFTFGQEARSYASTHHSTGDTIREIREADLRQASVVMALAAFLAAQ